MARCKTRASGPPPSTHLDWETCALGLTSKMRLSVSLPTMQRFYSVTNTSRHAQRLPTTASRITRIGVGWLALWLCIQASAVTAHSIQHAVAALQLSSQDLSAPQFTSPGHADKTGHAPIALETNCSYCQAAKSSSVYAFFTNPQFVAAADTKAWIVAARLARLTQHDRNPASPRAPPQWIARA